MSKISNFSVIILGAPHCGKRTLINQLTSDFGYSTLKVFDIEEEVKKSLEKGNTWSQTIRRSIDDNKPVPDTVLAMLFKDFQKSVGDSVLVSRGFPRNVAQFDWYGEECVDENRDESILVIHLIISHEGSLRRMLVKGQYSKTELLEKFDLYERNTLPVIELMKRDRRYKVVNIDAERKPATIMKKVLESIAIMTEPVCRV